MQADKVVQLILEDGTVFEGKSFGAELAATGELVFSTAMVGYPESLTDTAYLNLILVFSYPIIGNYGVRNDSFTNGVADYYNSDKIQASGLIVSDYSHNYSHWSADKSLSDWLKLNNIPAIYGIDTRKLCKTLSSKGTQKAKIVFKDASEIDFKDISKENLVAKVSIKEVQEYGNGDKTVVLVDCGVQHSTIRNLKKRGLKIIRVPYDYDFSKLEYDGVFISSGPGNPELCTATIENISKVLKQDKPIYGYGMGSHVLALASGAKTSKMKTGHRSQNHPVRMAETTTCHITFQNHGYVINKDSLSNDWEILFESLNDGSCEGIIHKTKPFLSANFMPEFIEDSAERDFFEEMFINKL